VWLCAQSTSVDFVRRALGFIPGRSNGLTAQSTLVAARRVGFGARNGFQSIKIYLVATTPKAFGLDVTRENPASCNRWMTPLVVRFPLVDSGSPM
jgi:hypothetical protein